VLDLEDAGQHGLGMEFDQAPSGLDLALRDGNALPALGDDLLGGLDRPVVAPGGDLAELALIGDGRTME
jgi:hypothetical protein